MKSVPSIQAASGGARFETKVFSCADVTVTRWPWRPKIESVSARRKASKASTAASKAA
jgi:hypothetical protein